jgi:hypothetical protein
MTEEARPSAVTVESTYKAREVEGILDLYFYRKVGFWLAGLFARLRLTPSLVTGIGGIFGVAAGHLYFYPDLRLNLIGMGLHVCANALDNADGQLARLTATQSREGRTFDAFVDHVVWAGIYLHLTLRCAGGAPSIYLLGIAAAVSHSLQGGFADNYRNTYLHFLKDGSAEGLERSGSLMDEYRSLAWTKPWNKFLLSTHLAVVRLLESFGPNLCRLRDDLSRSGTENVGVREYLELARPAFKWWGFLMTNTRMLLLFGCLLLGRPLWYLCLELTVFNLLLFYLIRRQEKMSRSLLRGSAPRSAVLTASP